MMIHNVLLQVSGFGWNKKAYKIGKRRNFVTLRHFERLQGYKDT